jgi:hypothetical protein
MMEEESLYVYTCLERRLTLDAIQEHKFYKSLSEERKKKIEDDVQDFFARRYNSFVAIILVSEAIQPTNPPASAPLRIEGNEVIIGNARRDQLLILPDKPWNSGYLYLPLLLREQLVSQSGGGLDEKSAKETVLTLNRQRWGKLLEVGINHDPKNV